VKGLKLAIAQGGQGDFIICRALLQNYRFSASKRILETADNSPYLRGF
jgi:hypothetical protein